MAPAAQWASCSDALHMIAGWRPEVANREVDQLNEGEVLRGGVSSSRSVGPPRFRGSTQFGQLERRGLEIGNMVGDITRLPLPGTTFGRQ